MSLRVFAPTATALRAGEEIVLDGDESHYLRRVRRARDGASVDVFDGVGGIWSATVLSGDSRATRIAALEPLPLPSPPPRLTLLLGLPEASAALQAITQACELGAAAITLVVCARSQGAPPSGPRIERVLRAAQRQCGRPTPPRITGPAGLEQALTEPPEDPGFFAWEALRGQTDRDPPIVGGARLLVGPEGGLTVDEAARARGAGFVPLALGPWTLRTETAALVGLSRLLFAARGVVTGDPAARP